MNYNKLPEQLQNACEKMSSEMVGEYRFYTNSGLTKEQALKIVFENSCAGNTTLKLFKKKIKEKTP